MQLALLVDKRLLPIPATVTVVAEFGTVPVVNPEGRLAVVGEHMILQADAQAFRDWLRPFDGIWVGKGIPQLQQFDVMHIK